jgi:hypothetical protein
MANNAKAPSSALLQPSSLPTVVCATDVVAITQQGKEQATCQGTVIHAVTAFHCCASLDAPLQLLRLCMTGRNAQQYQGTVAHTATTLVVAPILCTAAIVAATEEGKEWPTMPRHHHLLCHHLSVLPPLLLLHKQTRDG